MLQAAQTTVAPPNGAAYLPDLAMSVNNLTVDLAAALTARRRKPADGQAAEECTLTAWMQTVPRRPVL
jgi:hypothetical protein